MNGLDGLDRINSKLTDQSNITTNEYKNWLNENLEIDYKYNADSTKSILSFKKQVIEDPYKNTAIRLMAEIEDLKNSENKQLRAHNFDTFWGFPDGDIEEISAQDIFSDEESIDESDLNSIQPNKENSVLSRIEPVKEFLFDSPKKVNAPKIELVPKSQSETITNNKQNIQTIDKVIDKADVMIKSNSTNEAKNDPFAMLPTTKTTELPKETPNDDILDLFGDIIQPSKPEKSNAPIIDNSLDDLLNIDFNKTELPPAKPVQVKKKVKLQAPVSRK